MSSRLSLAFAVTALAATVALAGCGMRGTLERPAPLYGAKAKADYDAEQAKAAADKKEDASMPEPKAAGGRYGPRPQAPESRNTSIRTDPIDGAPRDPRAGPGQATDFTHPH